MDASSVSMEPSSTEQIEENNPSPSSSLQLPMKVVEQIWGYLSIRDRVNVQGVSKAWRDHSRTNAYIWKNMLHLENDDQHDRPDICRDMRILLHAGKWTKMNFSSLAISLQTSTKEQIQASKHLLDLLPQMKVQNLVITSKTSAIFDCLSNMRQQNTLHEFESISGLYCLPETEREECIDFLYARMEALDLEDYPIVWTLLESRLKKAKASQDRALFKAVSKCSRLRSLILDVDCDVLSDLSQDMPISQCKLDILSVQNTTGEPASFLITKHYQSKYAMVKKARVIDLVDYEKIKCKKMLSKILSEASQTLEYFSVNLDTPSLGDECDRPNCDCITDSVARIAKLPNLFFLWMNVESSKKPAAKLRCPKLKFLRTNTMQSMHFFTEIPSIETLFITGTQSMDGDSWTLLSNIAADRLHTLYIYSDCLLEAQFFDFFLQAEKYPHLRKIVVLASLDPLFRLRINNFYNLSATQLYSVRKIDTLIWQCAKEDEYPGIDTRDYMREHFSPNFRCVKQVSDDPINEMEYSTELMGEFVRCKLIDKMNHFQQFLQREHQAWPFINPDSAISSDTLADLFADAQIAGDSLARASSPCESFYFYEEDEQDSNDFSLDSNSDEAI
ncbi:uncharacterized protein FA14DRAFT_160175 [Meira miltonrushii]|uniref:F-box domain-containing protein n=1 Tax=Meira miltonrushii TaxID=1280837 RepID=A0A316VAN6_9BASI|nr:uncharacterized protein FA14DRAFT_160175 [Meira miltonrushii]PWN34667.1 hypothetical protein FA14DRAFT_160175 [Meira miltonrushii]